MRTATNHCTYLLPIRRAGFAEEEAREFVAYFKLLAAAGCEVLVVDGSPSEVFAQHARLWAAVARHNKVDRRFGYLNDKVNGIHTGVELALHEKVLLADDDIRYTAADVARMCALLRDYEVVRPQNFLSQLPWWARMEAARMLINRATLRIGDYPGTCAFRRSTMLRVGHYDGDVLFDNEEIIRHFATAGAAINYATDFFIQKRAPQFRKWIEQRPRQAYEDFGLRAKTAAFATLPVVLLLAFIAGGLGGLLLSFGAVSTIGVALALAGHGRGKTRNYVSRWICLFAPLWILERSISTYWAIHWHLRHGGYPFGDKLLTKGIGRDWISGGRVAARAAAQQPNE
ncbi:MAG: glycosyltransferase family 2 protein [Verrucomicrobiota bacterium]|nr:glycosyltransferase family 2 protein [Verrucomicrobiota bacterium]